MGLSMVHKKKISTLKKDRKLSETVGLRAKTNN